MFEGLPLLGRPLGEANKRRTLALSPAYVNHGEAETRHSHAFRLSLREKRSPQARVADHDLSQMQATSASSSTEPDDSSAPRIGVAGREMLIRRVPSWVADLLG
jgi:hypothetical protein